MAVVYGIVACCIVAGGADAVANGTRIRLLTAAVCESAGAGCSSVCQAYVLEDRHVQWGSMWTPAGGA